MLGHSPCDNKAMSKSNIVPPVVVECACGREIFPHYEFVNEYSSYLYSYSALFP